jgi:hypothetical protein
MKKILAIIMMVCVLASVLCVPALAAEETLPDPAEGTFLRVTATKGEDTVLIGDYTNFEEGWHDAIRESTPRYSKWTGYERVIVDFYSDWTSAADGNFTDDVWQEANGFGFNNDTIEIPDDAVITVNLNGHTIKRVLPDSQSNGEVIYIDEDADVIINNGTITGGKSTNGAGGIHIHDANVTLNNVNVIGNVSCDDDGGGIALYDGASLVMNGGSLKDNELLHETVTCYGGAIYAEESFVTLNDVEIKNNQTLYDHDRGAAIYADESTVALNGCTVDGNGIKDEANNIFAAASIIHAIESSITVKNTSFTNNGGLHYVAQGRGYYDDVSTLIYLNNSSLVMDGCCVSQNILGHLIQATKNSEFFVSGTNMSFNNATVLKSTGHSIDSYFNGCTFDNNNTSVYMGEKYSFLKYSFNVNSPVTFYNCNMGNSTYSNPANIKFINQNLDAGIVLTVSGRKADGTIVKVEEYRSFEEGWAAAMDLATNSYWMFMNLYEYVVVDMHVDWIASKGRFTDEWINGIGFNSDTIYVSEEACLILNMNGYKIDRGLTDAEDNGEVMYIASGADIIINNGTITGGFSNNGAGGIHISGDAKVTLNNVHVDGNKVKNDDGAGIAVYGGATLTMNGGSISNNVSIGGELMEPSYGGGIYINNSTVSLIGVILKNNSCESEYTDKMYGSAIYSTDSTVMLKDCSVDGNGVTKDDASYFCASTIYAEDSTLVIENTNFNGNGSKNIWEPENSDYYKGSTVLCVSDSVLTMTGGKFTDNNQVFLFSIWDSVVNVDGVDFTGNNSLVMNVRDASAEESVFANCKFSAGSVFKEFKYDFQFKDKEAGIKFVDCDFGEATFNNKNAVKFVGGTVSNGAGSIFGAGSLTNILVIVSLIASGVCIFLTVYYNKKKAVPVAANKAADTETEE